MIKQIKELISPTLKSGARYNYAHTDEANLCKKCDTPHRRGMIQKDTSEFYCAKCYVKYIGSELKATFNKRTVALVIAGLVMFFLVNVGFSIYLIIPEKTVSNDDAIWEEVLVEYFYPRTDKKMSKDIIALQINTILKTKYPTLALAIWKNESNGDIGAISTANCRGPFQVMPGKDNKSKWIPDLIKDGIIEDYRDLHDPVKGVIAGDKVLGYHFTRAKGNLLLGLQGYVGAREKKDAADYIEKVFTTYGKIEYLKLAMKAKKLDPKEIDTWWKFPEPKDDKIKPVKKGKPWKKNTRR